MQFTDEDELCKRLHISHKYLYRIMTGTGRIPKSLAERIANAYNLSERQEKEIRELAYGCISRAELLQIICNTYGFSSIEELARFADTESKYLLRWFPDRSGFTKSTRLDKLNDFLDPFGWMVSEDGSFIKIAPSKLKLWSVRLDPNEIFNKHAGGEYGFLPVEDPGADRYFKTGQFVRSIKRDALGAELKIIRIDRTPYLPYKCSDKYGEIYFKDRTSICR